MYIYICDLFFVTLCSDDIDDNYLTTIERPCGVEHLDAVPADIRVAWLTVQLVVVS